MLGRLLIDLFKGAARKRTERDVVALDDLRCLVKGRHGWFLANRYDRYLGAALIRYGEYSEIEHAFLASLLRPGENVIEVGANIGAHTIGLAKTVGPAGSVVAVEAQPEIFQVLCANLALNGLSNVVAHPCGCGSRVDTMFAPAVDYRSTAGHNSGGVSLDYAGTGAPVRIVPLDDLAVDLRSVRLIKIDVEGMEKDVLEGSGGLIAKHRPLIYLENDRPDLSQALIEWIAGRGYRLWWHSPPLFNPANFFGVRENDYPDVVSANMFCQPREMVPLAITGGLSEATDPRHHPFRG